MHGIAPDPERVDAIATRKASIFESMMCKVPFFPGVEKLVRSLSREMPLAVASGALHGEIESVLSAGGLRDAFTAIVGADDVSRGKPHPEPYLAAMARVEPRAPGLRPSECLVVEDTMPGIAAGLAAGMRVLAVTNSYPAAKLSAAHRVLDSLDDVQPADLRLMFGG